MSSTGAPMRVAKFLGTVLLVTLAVTLMIFGGGAILDRVNSDEPIAQEQSSPTTLQPATSPPAASQEPIMTQAPDPIETPAATVEPAPASTPPAAPDGVPGMNPAAAVHQYLANEPWYDPEGPGTSIVESLTVEDDDVIIRLVTDFEANATTTFAPSIVADSTRTLQAHRDDPAIGGLDLLAVYSADGVMVGSDSISGRPQAAS